MFRILRNAVLSPPPLPPSSSKLFKDDPPTFLVLFAKRCHYSIAVAAATLSDDYQQWTPPPGHQAGGSGYIGPSHAPSRGSFGLTGAGLSSDDFSDEEGGGQGKETVFGVFDVILFTKSNAATAVFAAQRNVRGYPLIP